MDPVSQGILGVAAAQAVSNRPWVRRAAFMGLVAGLAPDADVFIHSATDPLLSLQFHRHFTHALAFIPFGALLVALVLHPLAGRKTLRFSTTYLFLPCGLCYTRSTGRLHLLRYAALVALLRPESGLEQHLDH